MFSNTIISAALKSAAARRAFLAGILALSLSLTSFAQASPNQTNAGNPTPTQNKPAVSRSAAAMEFPVILQQKVVAGKTPVGTKVQAKLTLATLLADYLRRSDRVCG